MNLRPQIDIRKLYDAFDIRIVPFDCGEKCAPYNPSGKPFCCDICHAVPAVYQEEWEYLQPSTNLWHEWGGDECESSSESPTDILAETPDSMILLACLGPAQCQREYRALSCRQFPFFPYITSDYRFLGLAYEWEYEETCWVISHLEQVTDAYRREFIRTFDELFNFWIDEMDNYAICSEQMREHFANQRRRIPILHRNGGIYLLSPGSERIRLAKPESLPKFGVYREV
jgi:hypothetical protein